MWPYILNTTLGNPKGFAYRYVLNKNVYEGLAMNYLQFANWLLLSNINFSGLFG